MTYAVAQVAQATSALLCEFALLADRVLGEDRLDLVIGCTGVNQGSSVRALSRRAGANGP